MEYASLCSPYHQMVAMCYSLIWVSCAIVAPYGMHSLAPAPCLSPTMWSTWSLVPPSTCGIWGCSTIWNVLPFMLPCAGHVLVSTCGIWNHSTTWNVLIIWSSGNHVLLFVCGVWDYSIIWKAFFLASPCHIAKLWSCVAVGIWCMGL